MASRLNQNYTKFPISNDSTSNNTELTLRLKADLQIAEGAEIETAHINKLLVDTDPELLMPSKREQQRASGQIRQCLRFMTCHYHNTCHYQCHPFVIVMGWL